MIRVFTERYFQTDYNHSRFNIPNTLITFTSSRCYTLLQGIILGMILAHLAQIWVAHFFFQTSWSAIIMCNIKTTNDAILRKRGDKRTDGQTKRHMDRWTRVISWNAVRLKSSVQQSKRSRKKEMDR